MYPIPWERKCQSRLMNKSSMEYIFFLRINFDNTNKYDKQNTKINLLFKTNAILKLKSSNYTLLTFFLPPFLIGAVEVEVLSTLDCCLDDFRVLVPLVVMKASLAVLVEGCIGVLRIA